APGRPAARRGAEAAGELRGAVEEPAAHPRTDRDGAVHPAHRDLRQPARRRGGPALLDRHGPALPDRRARPGPPLTPRPGPPPRAPGPARGRRSGGGCANVADADPPGGRPLPCTGPPGTAVETCRDAPGPTRSPFADPGRT